LSEDDMTESGPGETVQSQLNEILDRVREAPAPALGSVAAGHPRREALDLEMREIKDDILRMGSYVEEAILAAIAALVAHDADAATAVIVADGRINEMQREVSGLITSASVR